MMIDLGRVAIELYDIVKIAKFDEIVGFFKKTRKFYLLITFRYNVLGNSSDKMFYLYKTEAERDKYYDMILKEINQYNQDN